MRLDNYLVDKGLLPSRNIAQGYIKKAKVLVNGAIVTKSAFDVKEGSEVQVEADTVYVSRAAQKLKGFLLEHEVAIANNVVLDIGASTGGFTQVLLEYQAKEVVAVDVGSNQLHETLACDARVACIEQQDIRTFKHAPFDVVVCDVSFISVHPILEAIDTLSSKDIIILFKPQFEVGKTAKRTKQGVVTDMKAIELALRRFEDAAALLGWHKKARTASKIKGKEGNVEYFVYFSK